MSPGNTALAAFAAALALGGCAASAPEPLLVPYASGHYHGYSEERIDADTLRIRYRGPARPLSLDPGERAGQVEKLGEESGELALWRSAQIALAEGRPALRVLDRRIETEQMAVAGGFVHDDFYYPFPHGYPRAFRTWSWPTPSMVPPDAAGRAEAILVVRLDRAVTGGNFDARLLAERLQGRHGGRNADSPP